MDELGDILHGPHFRDLLGRYMEDRAIDAAEVGILHAPVGIGDPSEKDAGEIRRDIAETLLAFA